MKYLIKSLTALVSVLLIGCVLINAFGFGDVRMISSPLITAYASTDLRNPLLGASEELQTQGAPDSHLLPYPQVPSMFSNMDVHYAYLIIQQWLDQSFLRGNATLSLENGTEFVIKCWSGGMGLEITEALADNQTRLNAWQDAVDTLWYLDATLSRDIKESLGTNMSVSFLIVDDIRPEAVLLKIKDGCIEYNLFRDGNNPKYEAYGNN